MEVEREMDCGGEICRPSRVLDEDVEERELDRCRISCVLQRSVISSTKLHMSFVVILLNGFRGNPF